MLGIMRLLSVLMLLVIGMECMAAHINEPKVNQRQTSPLDIKNVHLIFMNHLDVGYDGISPKPGLIVNVLNTYFTEYFPRVYKVYGDLIQNKYEETFIYTTHPWLADLYINCPPNLVLSGIKLQCPTIPEAEKFVQAIKAGVIHWHAGPMNMYYEIMDPLELRLSLNISARLDALFQLHKPHRVLSQRDVPGVTIGMVPTLADNNIIGISNGINPACATVDLPPISRWTYSDKEVFYVENKGGYPNNPGPVPNNPGGLAIDKCHWVPGLTDAICFAFRGDNSGPPESYKEVLSNYEIVRKEFPNAKVFASTFENFFGILAENRDKIPISKMEIGDTWVQGVGSDPRKLAEYKAVIRVLTDCERRGLCDFTESRMVNASRFLVKLSEHTYGINTAGDSTHWSNAQFAEIRNAPNIKLAESSWLEQRQFLYLAIEAMGNHPIVPVIMSALSDLRPSIPPPNNPEPEKPTYDQFCSGTVTAILKFAKDGSIEYLMWDGDVLIKPPGKIGQIMYRTYNESDTALFMKIYSYHGNTGYGKAGSTRAAHPKSQWWPLSVDRIIKRAQEVCTFDVHVKNVLPEAETFYGSAPDYWLTFALKPDKSIDVTFRWYDKKPTRLMETIFVGFSPDGESTDWSVSKIGHSVDPYSVALNGSQWQQGMDNGGITLKTSTHQVKITATECAFVAPWTSNYGPTVWPVPLSSIPRKPGIKGMAFPIYNNVWNTNFIYWYPFEDKDKDFKSRFHIRWTAADHSLRFRPTY